MAIMQQSQPQASTAVNTTVKLHTVEEVASIVVDGADTAEKLSKRLHGFYRILQDDPYSMSQWTKKLSKSEKEKLPGQMPTLVKAMMDKGLADTTAEQYFRDMRAFTEAFTLRQWTPPEKTESGRVFNWNDARTATKEILSDIRTKVRAEKAQANDAAHFGIVRAQVESRLSPEEQKDAEKILAAREAAIAEYHAQKQRAKINGIASDAVKKCNGLAEVKMLSERLAEILANLQTQASAKTVTPAEVPSAENQAQAPEKQREAA